MKSVDSDTGVGAFSLSPRLPVAQTMRITHWGIDSSSASETESSGSIGRLRFPSLQFDRLCTSPQIGSIATVVSLQDCALMEDGLDDVSLKTTHVSEAGPCIAGPQVYKESTAQFTATIEEHAVDHCLHGAGHGSSASANILSSENCPCNGMYTECDPCQRSTKDVTLAKFGDEINACDEVWKRLACNMDVHRPVLTTTDRNSRACSECRQTASCKVSMPTRVLNHVDEKPSFCEERSQVIKTSDVGSRTSDKPEVGDESGKWFSEKSRMTTHMLSHAREEPHVCAEYGRRFLDSSTLTKHVLIHNGQKPHACSECGQWFSRKSNMTTHMLTHTKEKPHMCGECGQRFSLKCRLESHMVTHTGEKPHACSECGQRFAVKSNMTRHMMTHTGEKPHMCSECGRRFLQKCHMMAHMLTHTREAPP